MVGRKPKPTQLRVLQGNPGKRAINKQEPMFSSDLPQPPQYLNERAKEIFCELRDEIDQMGYASRSHARALGLVATRLEEVEHCAAVLDQSGYYYETTTEWGETIKHIRPEVSIRQKSLLHAHSLLAEFGLTPSSASRIVVPSKQKNNAFAKL